MRVNLLTQTAVPYIGGETSVPLSLTIRPACGLPGTYVYSTDAASLMRLLRRATDLPSTVLQRFEGDMQKTCRAKLLGIEIKDSALSDIGYFTD